MIIHGKDVKPTACEPGVSRKVLCHNEVLMMCEISFEKGAKGAMHKHPHHQITYVQRGSLRFTIDGQDQVVHQGDSILIPPDALHGVEALEAAVLVDVFNPRRGDFL